MLFPLDDVYCARIIFKGEELVRIVRTPVDDVPSFDDFFPLVPVDFERTTSNYGDVNVVLGVLMHGKHVASTLKVKDRAAEFSKMYGRRI